MVRTEGRDGHREADDRGTRSPGARWLGASQQAASAVFRSRGQGDQVVPAAGHLQAQDGREQCPGDGQCCGTTIVTIALSVRGG